MKGGRNEMTTNQLEFLKNQEVARANRIAEEQNAMKIALSEEQLHLAERMQDANIENMDARLWLDTVLSNLKSKAQEIANYDEIKRLGLYDELEKTKIYKNQSEFEQVLDKIDTFFQKLTDRINPLSQIAKNLK